MLDQPAMSRATASSYPPYPAHPPQQKHYPAVHGSSSAFSASANPNEDWTKISDLAERRRIQNRIAQRNYRKKLKKRLEDLERRAGSSSASPEQRPTELAEVDDALSTTPSVSPPIDRSRSSTDPRRHDCTLDVPSQHYLLPIPDDRSMFSQQSTRQLSTSPPPFTYASVSAIDTNTATYDSFHTVNAFCSPSATGLDAPLYPQYLPPIQHNTPFDCAPSTLAAVTASIKAGLFAAADDDMSPFGMSYASIAGVDVSAAHSFQDLAAYTPPLSDSIDFSQAGSPLDDTTAYPRTPASMPRTPPLYFYDQI